MKIKLWRWELILQNQYIEENEMAKGWKGRMEENSYKHYVLWTTVEWWGDTED